jgi:hypothetical protein
VAAFYEVVDSVGSLVDSQGGFPYRRFFTGNAAFLSDPMFLMWAKTAYSFNASAASVRVNGTEIGKISPRPFAPANLALEAESLIFQRGVLFGAPFSFITVFNTLEIVTVPLSGADPRDSSTWVIVDNVIFFRNSF